MEQLFDSSSKSDSHGATFRVGEQI